MSLNKLIITFDSTQHAMMAEMVLKKENIPVTLIVTPRSVTSNCGFSLLIEFSETGQLKEILINSKTPFNKIYKKELREEITYYEAC